MVTSIPLSKLAIPDKLIWTESVIGQFAVKLTYFKAHMALGKEINIYEDRSPIWRIIWTTKVIPKVRMVLWRLVHNIVLFVRNLREKAF